jgi:anti-sigma-K factor RskA
VEEELIHDRVAGYALDALEPEEERAFEEHLACCDRCREELAGFSALATSLAFAAPDSEPPPQLRGRVLAAARAERENVVAIRRRRPYALVAVAAAAVCVAIGLGVWGATRPGSQPAALSSLPLHGAAGTVLVARNGRATLVVSGLKRAPAGKTYEAWVMEGRGVRAAGLFSGAAPTTVLPLHVPVPAGARVAVTIEPAGGSAHPTRTPLVISAAA